MMETYTFKPITYGKFLHFDKYANGEYYVSKVSCVSDADFRLSDVYTENSAGRYVKVGNGTTTVRIVREDLFGDKERRTGDRNPVSYSVFIDPPLSRIGLNEEEARRQNRDIIVKKLPVMAIPRAKTLGETDGLLKAIIDKNTGKILGCVLFAPDSGEVINTVAVAMKTGQDYTFLRDFIFTHPSMSEALNDLFS